MGKLISQSVFETLVANYKELYGEEESYTKFSTISFKSLGITHPNQSAVAYRAYNGYDGHQTKTLLVLVDEDGNELDPIMEEDGSTEKSGKNHGKKAVQDDGPTCPPSCG